jgi:hypothetical protein
MMPAVVAADAAWRRLTIHAACHEGRIVARKFPVSPMGTNIRSGATRKGEVVRSDLSRQRFQGRSRHPGPKDLLLA